MDVLESLAMSAGCVLGLAYLLLPLLAALWILIPLDRAARNGSLRTRFAVVDFLSLMFVLALPMAFVRCFLGDQQPLVLPMSIGWTISAAIWWVGVSTLSRSGVDRAADRAIVVFFVLPCAYFAAFAAALLPPLMLLVSADWSVRIVLLLVELVLVACLVSAGVLSRRIVARAGASPGRAAITAQGHGWHPGESLPTNITPSWVVQWKARHGRRGVR